MVKSVHSTLAFKLLGNPCDFELTETIMICFNLLALLTLGAVAPYVTEAALRRMPRPGKFKAVRMHQLNAFLRRFGRSSQAGA
jgi:hypothetical protein